MKEAPTGTRRGWVRPAVVLAAVTSILLVAGRYFLSGPSIARAQRAYEQGDWQSAVADAAVLLEKEPGDERAIRLKGRGLARLGRTIEALALDSRLGGDHLEAEDLFLAGQALVLDKRLTLGWAAIDAASRLDPKHPGAAEALASRPRGADAAAKADRLSTVPGGPALAELVMGLATLGYESSSGGNSNRLLERVLLRDRSMFLKVNSPAAARKLLARLLLEDGRAREACDWIGSIDDPEAHWLLSRAYLVEGDLKRARASVKRAGSFGTDEPLTMEPSRYLGAKQCAECHREIFDAQQSSHHSATITWGDGLNAVPLPEGTVIDPENPTVVHRFERDGGSLKVSANTGTETVRAVIDYALGSGHHGVTMLAREEDGRHRSLRLSYYSGGRYWGLTNGFEARPADPHGYIGEVLNDDSFRNCLNCHSTRFTSEQDRKGPEVADHGIGCERCHGPGDHHVRAVESSFDQLAIARPKLATPARRLKLCAQCHSSDGVIPPADPRFIRFQATTLPYSRCVSESGGRLDCVACHDPHRDVATNPAYYEARCLACHGEKRGAQGLSSSVRVEAMATSRCKVNASNGCITCHMPKVEKIMPFMSFTDHHIRVHRPFKEAETPRERR